MGEGIFEGIKNYTLVTSEKPFIGLNDSIHSVIHTQNTTFE